MSSKLAVVLVAVLAVALGATVEMESTLDLQTAAELTLLGGPKTKDGENKAWFIRAFDSSALAAAANADPVGPFSHIGLAPVAPAGTVPNKPTPAEIIHSIITTGNPNPAPKPVGPLSKATILAPEPVNPLLPANFSEAITPLSAEELKKLQPAVVLGVPVKSDRAAFKAYKKSQEPFGYLGLEPVLTNGTGTKNVSKSDNQTAPLKKKVKGLSANATFAKVIPFPVSDDSVVPVPVIPTATLAKLNRVPAIVAGLQPSPEWVNPTDVAPTLASTLPFYSMSAPNKPEPVPGAVPAPTFPAQAAFIETAAEAEQEDAWETLSLGAASLLQDAVGHHDMSVSQMEQMNKDLDLALALENVAAFVELDSSVEAESEAEAEAEVDSEEALDASLDESLDAEADAAADAEAEVDAEEPESAAHHELAGAHDIPAAFKFVRTARALGDAVDALDAEHDNHASELNGKLSFLEQTMDNAAEAETEVDAEADSEAALDEAQESEVDAEDSPSKGFTYATVLPAPRRVAGVRFVKRLRSLAVPSRLADATGLSYAWAKIGAYPISPYVGAVAVRTHPHPAVVRTLAKRLSNVRGQLLNHRAESGKAVRLLAQRVQSFLNRLASASVAERRRVARALAVRAHDRFFKSSHWAESAEEDKKEIKAEVKEEKAVEKAVVKSEVKTEAKAAAKEIKKDIAKLTDTKSVAAESSAEAAKEAVKEAAAVAALLEMTADPVKQPAPPLPPTQAPKTEAPKTEAPKTEAPKTEAPKTEAPKTEAPKTEAPKTEAPKTEAPKTEAPKTEAPKTEAPKAEAPKAEAAKPEVKADAKAAADDKAAAEKKAADDKTAVKVEKVAVEAADAVRSTAKAEPAAPIVVAPKDANVTVDTNKTATVDNKTAAVDTNITSSADKAKADMEAKILAATKEATAIAEKKTLEAAAAEKKAKEAEAARKAAEGKASAAEKEAAKQKSDAEKKAAEAKHAAEVAAAHKAKTEKDYKDVVSRMEKLEALVVELSKTSSASLQDLVAKHKQQLAARAESDKKLAETHKEHADKAAANAKAKIVAALRVKEEREARKQAKALELKKKEEEAKEAQKAAAGAAKAHVAAADANIYETACLTAEKFLGSNCANKTDDARCVKAAKAVTSERCLKYVKPATVKAAAPFVAAEIVAKDAASTKKAIEDKAAAATKAKADEAAAATKEAKVKEAKAKEDKEAAEKAKKDAEAKVKAAEETAKKADESAKKAVATDKKAAEETQAAVAKKAEAATKDAKDAADKKAAEEKKATEEKKAADEKKAAEDKKAADAKKEAEKKVADAAAQKAEADKKAAEAKAAEAKAAADKAAADKAAADKKAADAKTATKASFVEMDSEESVDAEEALAAFMELDTGAEEALEAEYELEAEAEQEVDADEAALNEAEQDLDSATEEDAEVDVDDMDAVTKDITKLAAAALAEDAQEVRKSAMNKLPVQPTYRQGEAPAYRVQGSAARASGAHVSSDVFSQIANALDRS